MKETGILLPVSSLPSSWGVGELGNAIYEWMELLSEMGITIWQILPLNPVGYGNSPYQPYSSYAGDELYLSLSELAEDGLLEQTPSAFRKQAHRVDYDEVRAYKEIYLRKAWASFQAVKGQDREEYKKFAGQKWAWEYSVYRALKKANNKKCWNEWPKEQRDWPEKKTADLTPYQEEIEYQMFLQFQFSRQWQKVKVYARKKNIRIMGDVPFYVGVDSVDVWAGKDNFLLGVDGNPTFIAGVPPDYFSATGQRWGNPIYDWEHMRKTGYQFWTDRIGYNQELFDIIRIDHFRAFDTFWKIPASCPTAEEGEWIEAPGYEVLDTLMAKIPGINLVAEDLGDLRPEVGKLKEFYGLKGMKILEFELDLSGKYAFDRFQDTENLIVYTGTHDNATLREWYEDQTTAGRRKIRRWLKRLGIKTGSVTERMIRYTLESKADYVILPAADILEEGPRARLNLPGTVGSPNWEWKLADFEKMKSQLKKYRHQIADRRYRR